MGWKQIVPAGQSPQSRTKGAAGSADEQNGGPPVPTRLQSQVPKSSWPHSVSPSSQAWQTPAEQNAPAQSLRPWQVWPLAQRGQAGPPQSTPVSVPFLRPSTQVGAGGRGGNGGGDGGPEGGEAGGECFFLCFLCLAVVSARPSRPSVPPNKEANAPRRERARVRSRER